MSRVLGVLLGKGTYRFTTYSSKVPEVAAELKYLADMEGSWVYLYFSYKQFSPTQGSAVAFSCHSTELINGA
jgi:hypothetical protein